MRTIATVLFPGFELLDVFGPLEMFGMLKDEFELHMVAETPGPIASGMGPRTTVDHLLADDRHYDILLVPGGPGTRREVNNTSLHDWLRKQAEKAELITSVCTGSAVLAAAGLLEGKRATTNKNAFDWATSFGSTVDWQHQARWVHDRPFFTSSGVSAGMDMSLGIIAHLLGKATAEQVAVWAEYVWNADPEDDPFAKTPP